MFGLYHWHRSYLTLEETILINSK